jgi:hypothetical protein
LPASASESAPNTGTRRWRWHTPDAVYIVQTSDGKEIFRRRLPAFAHADVQFLGASRVAYTDFDGSDGYVRVVQVPDSVGR